MVLGQILFTDVAFFEQTVPLLQALQQRCPRLHDEGRAFDLHYCAHSVSRAAFNDWLSGGPFTDQVHLHISGQRADMCAVLQSTQPGCHLYTCGPVELMEHVLTSARELGWSEERLHREHFAAAPTNHATDTGFDVRLRSSGMIYSIPADRSITQVLDEAGICIPVTCEQEICGTCLTGVLEGEPDHRDSFLTTEERVTNDQFTPCCSRARSACLVLDL